MACSRSEYMPGLAALISKRGNGCCPLSSTLRGAIAGKLE
ncbi:hypothetical protein XCR_0083 [Xanthomonas campestris pv. raphani 756C]|nr:hypothetical protein XCR_0083 [Xanthomonas campestris pv. raphani 756C]